MSSVYAVGVSPSNLVFDLQANEEVCQNVYVDFDTSEAEAFDVWGVKEKAEWKFAEFKSPSSIHGVSITYPKTISQAGEATSVCVKGKYTGEFHGAFVIKEEAEGNVVSQAAVWLLVNIEGGEEKPFAQEDEDEVPATTSLSADNSEAIGAGSQNSNAPSITGNVVNEGGSWMGVGLWVVVGATIGIVLIWIYTTMRRRREIWGDY